MYRDTARLQCITLCSCSDWIISFECWARLIFFSLPTISSIALFSNSLRGCRGKISCCLILSKSCWVWLDSQRFHNYLALWLLSEYQGTFRSKSERANIISFSIVPNQSTPTTLFPPTRYLPLNWLWPRTLHTLLLLFRIFAGRNKLQPSSSKVLTFQLGWCWPHSWCRYIVWRFELPWWNFLSCARWVPDIFCLHRAWESSLWSWLFPRRFQTSSLLFRKICCSCNSFLFLGCI